MHQRVNSVVGLDPARLPRLERRLQELGPGRRLIVVVPPRDLNAEAAVKFERGISALLAARRWRSAAAEPFADPNGILFYEVER